MSPFPPTPNSTSVRKKFCVPEVSVSISPSLSPSPAPSARPDPVPLLTLAPPALALGDHLEVGKPGDGNNFGEIWNVIARASDLVKDGHRLENLAWRVWSAPSRPSPRPRRLSMSTQGTASTTSLQSHDDYTSHSEYPSSPTRSDRSSFGAALNLLVDGQDFKDWVTDAKRSLPPILSVPDTPVANLEIRLVEPTPVPSRVGSLGGSMTPGGLFSSAAGGMPPPLDEEDAALDGDNEEINQDGQERDDDPEGRIRRAPKKKGGKFFLHSSPTKGSGSDSNTSPVPTKDNDLPVMPMPPVKRHSSGSSSGIVKMRPKERNGAQKRQVSLSTMRGRFQAEKRKAVEAIRQAEEEREAKDEESGWEDEDEAAESDANWSDESQQAPSPTKRNKKHVTIASRSPNGASAADLTRILSRQPSREPRGTVRDPPPPPAPTPLKKMSRREREAAEAERTRIENELEAQRQREMFAKQQIFGSRPSEGLLTDLFKRGGSMVDLPGAKERAEPSLRPSPTFGNLPGLMRDSHAGPSVLRSKSAIAFPVQTGVSVTVAPHTPLHAPQLSSHTPKNVAMESDDDGSEDDYLATSQTRRKLAELQTKKEGSYSSAQAVPLPNNSITGAVQIGVIQPLSPTSRRRAMITREMSESLRRNLILERQKSSGVVGQRVAFVQPRPPPLVQRREAGLTTHKSAVNLSQFEYGHPLERKTSLPPNLAEPLQLVPAFNTRSRGGSTAQSPEEIDRPPIPRHHHPLLQPTPHPQPQPQLHSQSYILPSHTFSADPNKRSVKPTILGGFLRPLTRVGSGEAAGLPRTHSSAELTASPSDSEHRLEAPAMVRSNTDGDRQRLVMEGRMRRRELQRRGETMDTGYRYHGW
ncbi:hypothetical protein M231_03151 [Tremella mesenterica]|uniref:Uncharacterized protein n=1 Tax=Tremella mesenterica TaxID=5217 RepID=A0A4Q1BNN1_TREME|nr:hypothetical protein M231_03151 [Tremella mesenterica]